MLHRFTLQNRSRAKFQDVYMFPLFISNIKYDIQYIHIYIYNIYILLIFRQRCAFIKL